MFFVVELPNCVRHCVWQFGNSMHCRLPGHSVCGISQARILNGLTFPFPRDLPDQGLKRRLLYCRQIPYHSAPWWEDITGRKARCLQMEEIGCKCQTLFSLLSRRRKQTRVIFFPLLYTNLKELSLKMLCCHEICFHLKLTLLNNLELTSAFFLIEMFVLSCVNVPRLCLQVGSAKCLNLLDKPVCYTQILFP